MSELKETRKIKVIALYEQTPKQFEFDPNPQKPSFFAPKSQKKLPLNQIELKARIEGDIDNICCSAT